MKRYLVLLSVITAIFFASVSATIGAPPDPRKYAITDISKVDEDFAFQGEYVGNSYIEDHGYAYIGLQIVARGGGNFMGVVYVGGLPGAGWNETERLTLEGKLTDGRLTLEGESNRITSDGMSATVYSVQSGSEIGSLVKTNRESITMGALAPANATILFDGTNTENLVDAKVTDDGLLEVGATTAMPVGDFRLHVEFRLPYMPYALGQARGNSGVYIQRRYETQILDSFGLEGLHNECGGIYRQTPPDINMCFPPLSWQTYDIWFTAARWDAEGKKTANARLTVLHNNVPIHWDRELPTKTGAGRPETPEPLPILFQDHGNPVNFRNIWILTGNGAGVPYASGESQQVVYTQRAKRCCFARLRCCLSRLRRCR